MCKAKESTVQFLYTSLYVSLIYQREEKKKKNKDYMGGV